MNNIKYHRQLTPTQRAEFNKNIITAKGVLQAKAYLHKEEYYEKDFYTFMNGAFIWARTPEGHNYWMEIAFNVKTSSVPNISVPNIEIESIIFTNNINHETKQILV